MPKKILLINTESPTNELFDIWRELDRELFLFSVLSNKNEIIQNAQKQGWPTKKLSVPILSNNLLNIFLLPLYFLFFLPYLAILKWRDNFQLLFCFGTFEKLVFTPLARLLSIKTLWFTYPEVNFIQENKTLINLLHFFSSWAETIVVTTATKQKLITAGFKNERIKTIVLGTNLNLYRHQDNIFSKLAATENHWPQRKFFTIGTVARLDAKQNIEILFSAIKKILDVVPLPQIIIVGEGQARKNLTWLAKKMNIENFVWFVGEQNNLKKWLDTFDIFVVTNDQVKLADFNIIIRAMAAGLPIIGPTNQGLEEIITNNENGMLIEASDSEDLAQIIIKLQQRKDWHSLISEKNKSKATDDFNIEKTLAAFTKLFY